ncbi:MAG: tRNA (cytidine(56)-2'-O)-methyltransferase [Conexivisphaera sp.]
MAGLARGGVYVLRMGHRAGRDKRVTTHVILSSMALGASGVIVSGDEDPKLMGSASRAAARWSPGFLVEYSGGWREPVRRAREAGLAVVHLTMYGVELRYLLDGLRLLARSRGLLVAVGAGKVPREVYEEADLNVAVTHLPHSEVAALAIFLHEVLGPRPPAAGIILPQLRGKLSLRPARPGSRAPS